MILSENRSVLMQHKILILFLLLTLSCKIGAQGKKSILFNYKGMSFTEFVSATESQLKVNFFYKEEWVSAMKLGDYPGSIELTDILDNLFRGTSVFYYIDNFGNVVLTKDFAVKNSYKSDVKETNFIPPSDYAGSGENQQTTGSTFVEIGNPAERNKQGNIVISGYITNKDTREPVAGVTVYNQRLSLGTISNEYGFYTMTFPRGIHILQYSFIGMKEKKINLNIYGSGEMNVEMNSMLIPLKETVVSAQKNMTLQRFEVGAEKINITSFRLSPTSMGESDIIKNVLLIPGVQSVGEGSAGFNVRGGSADQNLILLYGAPVYNSSHFFGFFSAVNSDIIKDVTLFKGGIPSRYGGRISSVLDIGTIEGNKKEFAGNAGISPITTHIMLEGPIKQDTLSYIITARTTYSNWIFGLIPNTALNGSRASFYDMNGKLTYDIDRNNKIEFSSYLSHDAFRISSDSVYSYYNNIFALRWRHFFNSRFISALSINNSFYKYDVSSQEFNAEAFDLSHKINSNSLKADFNWFHGRNEINFGLDLSRYYIVPGSYTPPNDSSLVVPHFIEKERAWEGALYIDDKFILTNFMSVNIGMRMSSYFSMGPGTVLVYSPEYSKSKSTITDTLNFKRGEIASKYAGPELRISLNFRIS
ncbi:MAG: hypothetical protein EPN88_08905, partial [Bacteroidetes bacterium]